MKLFINKNKILIPYHPKILFKFKLENKIFCIVFEPIIF